MKNKVFWLYDIQKNPPLEIGVEVWVEVKSYNDKLKGVGLKDFLEILKDRGWIKEYEIIVTGDRAKLKVVNNWDCRICYDMERKNNQLFLIWRAICTRPL